MLGWRGVVLHQKAAEAVVATASWDRGEAAAQVGFRLGGAAVLAEGLGVIGVEVGPVRGETRRRPERVQGRPGSAPLCRQALPSPAHAEAESGASCVARAKA